MALKSHFCARCGKDTDLTESSLCAQCYLSEHKIVSPRRIALRTCPKCGAIHWTGIWVKPEYELNYYLEQLFVNKMKLPEKTQLIEVTLSEKSITIKVNILGQDVDVEKPVDIKIEKYACPSCSRQFESNWLAKIQIRTKENINKDVIRYTKRYEDRIIRIEEEKNGLDIFFFEKPIAGTLASLLANKLDLRMSKTAENHKIKEGQLVFRDVILLKK